MEDSAAFDRKKWKKDYKRLSARIRRAKNRMKEAQRKASASGDLEDKKEAAKLQVKRYDLSCTAFKMMGQLHSALGRI